MKRGMRPRVKQIRWEDDALVEKVYALDARCLPGESWSLRAFYEEADKPGSCLSAAVDENNEVLGFLLAQTVLDEAELAKIAVSPEYRRQGIADMLLQHLFCLLGKDITVYLEVRESNAAAISLYEKHRFQRVGLRKRYYHAPEEGAVIMRRKPQREELC